MVKFHPAYSIMDIALQVKNRRRQLGLTQSQLAGLSNTGTRFIVDLESAKESIQMGKAIHVLKMLGLKLVLEQSDE